MERSDERVNAFYQSPAWRKVRSNYLKSKFGICERCGDVGTYVHHKTYINVNNIDDLSITLNWDNLELLCKDCHNKEHFGEKITYEFDELGNLVANDTKARNDFLEKL